MKKWDTGTIVWRTAVALMLVWIVYSQHQAKITERGYFGVLVTRLDYRIETGIKDIQSQLTNHSN